MGALVFFTLLNIANLLLCLSLVRLAQRKRDPGKSQAREPSFPTHAITIALSCFIFFLVIAFIPLRFPGFVPNLSDAELRLSLSYPFFQSQVVRTAILGYLIALAVYFWYWERCSISRKMRIRAKEAADDIIRYTGSSDPQLQEKVQSRLLGLVRRDNLADMGLFLILLLAIIFIEAPGVLRHISAEFSPDGRVRLGLLPADDPNRRASVPSNQGASDRQEPGPMLQLLAGRMENDFETICVLHASMAQGSALYDQSRNSATLSALARACAPPRLPHGWTQAWQDPGPRLMAEKVFYPGSEALAQLDTDMRLLLEYQHQSRNRTRAMALCLWTMAGDRDRGILLRGTLRPLIEQYMRLTRTMEKHGFTRATLRNQANQDIQAYARAIATLADPANPRRLERGDEYGACDAAIEFAEGLQAELDALSRIRTDLQFELPFCLPVEDPRQQFGVTLPYSRSGARPHSEALCHLMELEGLLPYGQYALALFVQLEDPVEAALLIERWLQLPAGTRDNDRGLKLSVLAQEWLNYVMVNQRNIFLSGIERHHPAASAPERLRALYPRASAAQVMQNYAPSFEDNARNAGGKICEERALQRLTLLLLLEYESYMIGLDRELKVLDPIAMQRAFENRLLQPMYERMRGIDDLLPCFGKWPPLQGVDGPRKAQSRHVAATYKRYYAEFLESEAGRGLLFLHPEDTPRTLRQQAIKDLSDALDIYRPLVEACRERPEKLLLAERQLCDPTKNANFPDGYPRAQYLLTAVTTRLSDVEREVTQLQSYLRGVLN